MGVYSKWSCVRVQLHNWKNAYSMWAGYIIYIHTVNDNLDVFKQKLIMYTLCSLCVITL